jgi:hypothetical protein
MPLANGVVSGSTSSHVTTRTDVKVVSAGVGAKRTRPGATESTAPSDGDGDDSAAEHSAESENGVRLARLVAMPSTSR